MPWLTGARAVLIAALLACVVYGNVLRNGWAMDDLPVVRENPSAHSIAAAVQNRFAPYWPPQADAAGGLYRPLIILSYAVDWTISGGRAWWFHGVNLLFHALATALVVLLLLQWLPPLGALVAGLVFAVHPLHVEAVANVVGRAELFAACGLFLAILAARRYRRAVERRARAGWMLATLVAVGGALLSKEHAVVAIALIALDQYLDPQPARRPAWHLYLAVAALTLAWLYLWRAIAAPYVESAVASNIRWLTLKGRLATMLPMHLDVVRLLVWPFNLSTDYSPQLVPQRTTWSLVSVLGISTSAAILALAAAVSKRAPAVTFGILAGAITYAPTSNLLFAAGTALAERALYIGVLGPAAVLGWLAARPAATRQRSLLAVAIGMLLLIFAAGTARRTAFWKDNPTIVIEDLIQHPENYRTHLRAGRVFEYARDSAKAMAEYLVSGALFDRDPFIAQYSVPLAIAMKRSGLAVSEGRRAYALAPTHPRIAEFLADAYVADRQPDSALAVTRRMVLTTPGNQRANRYYLGLLERLGAPRWELLLARARVDWVHFRLGSATQRLDSALVELAGAADVANLCWEAGASAAMFGALRPGLVEPLNSIIGRHGLDCQLGVGGRSPGVS